MPPRTAISSRVARLLQTEPYVCPSCIFNQAVTSAPRRRSSQAATINIHTTSRTSLRSAETAQKHLPKRRYATTGNGSLASSTAINAPTTVPPELRELHQQLQCLRENASSYVDLSRLQLAIRSLESADPVVRIAFLGLGSSGVKAARKLARVLLADALSDEEDWEFQLAGGVEDDGRSVLIKYGETVEDVGVQPATTPLVREMRIPSRLLRSSNVEILVTGLNASGLLASPEGARELEESILVPPLTIPNAGRVGFVRYPVHKAVVVAEGVQGAVEFGRLPASLVDGNLVEAALSLPLRKDTVPKTESDGREVDVGLAEHSLGLFRKNKANGAIFSSEWQTSRVGIVGNWIKESTTPDSAVDTGLKPAVKDLLTSLLKHAAQSVSQASSTAETSSTSLTVPDTKRQVLQNAIAAWSEEAHRDLQMNLSAALTSPTWKRTTWWRLFYRIDEVSISASDVLRRGWLVEAEQSLAFISGRVLEAGLASEQQLKGGATAEEAEKGSVRGLLDERTQSEVADWKKEQGQLASAGKIETVAELLQYPPLLSKIREESGLNAFFDPPWPQTIQLARQQMLHRVVPAMHLKAQKFLLASLSTIGGSGALGAWLWVASGGFALYEGGAIAALGLVWALRALQNKWSRERETFVETSREDARRVLRDVESRLGVLVRDGGKAIVREEDRQEWEEARRGVEVAKQMLVALEDKKA